MNVHTFGNNICVLFHHWNSIMHGEGDALWPISNVGKLHALEKPLKEMDKRQQGHLWPLKDV